MRTRIYEYQVIEIQHYRENTCTRGQSRLWIYQTKMPITLIKFRPQSDEYSWNKISTNRTIYIYKSAYRQAVH